MNVIIFVYYCMEPERISMVNWKVVLVVVIIAVLVMVVGMWFGYRYVSEQEDISPEGWHKDSNTIGLHFNELSVLAPTRGVTLKGCSFL